jgi:O-antigen/teichoic acid export membrane protein
MKMKSGLRQIAETGGLLTVANFVASVGQYIFQILMGHQLPLEEYGIMNSTLYLVLFVGVPLTAVGQSLAYFLARHHANEDTNRLANLQASGQMLLRRMTWIICIVAVIVIKPLTDFLHFPRLSLSIAALACVPIALWQLVANSWCAGLSKFKLLSVLLFVTVFVRLAAGLTLAHFFPVAEAGIWATFLMFWVIASVVIFHKPEPVDEQTNELRSKEFYRYLVAAMAVCFANFLFVQGDQIVAQRYVKGDILGIYTAAGQLGRAIVWGALPFLTVFFTKRAGAERTTRQTGALLGLFLGLAATGAVMLFFLKSVLMHVFIKTSSVESLNLVNHFSIGMFLVAGVHALGYYFLASGRLKSCLVIGAGGMLHAVTLVLYGKNPEMLVFLIQINAMLTLFLGGLVAITSWSRRHQ